MPTALGHFAQRVTQFAPAKINLGLHVLGRRPDGYHELDGLMAPLSVGDQLTLSTAPKQYDAAKTDQPANGETASIELEITGRPLANDSSNLVYQAAQTYLEATGLQLCVRISLHKVLPLASGLGGGSSDAAATLMALHALHSHAAHSAQAGAVSLPELALRLGADVPFFLLGGAARARGIGEQLTPMQLPACWVVLLHPAVGVSAAHAYGWLAGATSPVFDPAQVLQALAAPCGHPQWPYHNALQAEVVARHPEIAQALQALADVGLCWPLMSGSGSTCFAVARSQEQAEEAAQRLNAQYPHWWSVAAQLGGTLENTR